MTKISCDVFADLFPLVRDKIASSDSAALIAEHLSECSACRAEYKEVNMTETKHNDAKIISSMKRSVFRAAMLILLIGGIIGISLTYSMGMFYNFLIMPALGAVGYFMLREKTGWLLGAVTATTYLWVMFASMFSDGEISIYTFSGPLYITLIYALLCLVGVVIGILLCYIFGSQSAESK